MLGQSIVLVDAFASRPFAGNPAGVCLLLQAASAEWMQSVATEVNQADTAFAVRRDDGAFDLRWFTPVAEVALCGHATLACAHHLWNSGVLPSSEMARFHTLSGLLTATQQADGWIELDFPTELATPVPAPENLADVLGASPLFIGKNRMDYLVELEDEEVVRKLRPDLRTIASWDARGLIVTARSHSHTEAGLTADFISRWFGPAIGINEDPVTGSAHCALAPYWAERLGKVELVAYQASKRGGWLRVRHNGDRVLLRGKAITTLEGTLKQRT